MIALEIRREQKDRLGLEGRLRITVSLSLAYGLFGNAEYRRCSIERGTYHQPRELQENICREIFAGGREMNAFCRDFSHNLLPLFLAALGGEFLRLPCISIVIIVHEVEGAVEERAEDTDRDMLGVAM